MITVGDLQFVIGAQFDSLVKAQQAVTDVKESLRAATKANATFSNVSKQVESAVLRQVKVMQGARESYLQAKQKLDQLKKSGADTTKINLLLDRSFGRLRSQMASGIKTQTKINTEFDLFNRTLKTVNRGVNELTKESKSSSAATTDFSSKMTDLSKSIQVALGPLSGVASRLTALTSLANRNTFAIAGLVGGLIAFGAAASGAVRRGIAYERQMNILNNITHSFGKNIGFTSDQLNEMARKLGRDTLASAGGARQAIIALSTASGLSGENFRAALKAAQDLAATGFGDLESSARRLAQTFEAPAEGAERLRRIGVVFTDQQKAILEALDATGRKAESTAIIIGAINEKVGGNAEREAQSAAGAWDTLIEDVNKAAEKSIQKGGVLDRMAEGINKITDAFMDLTESGNLLKNFGSLIGVTFSGVIDAAAFLIRHLEEIAVAVAVLATGSAIKTMIANVEKIIGLFKRLRTVLTGTAIAGALASWPLLLAASLAITVGLLAKANLLERTWVAIKETIKQIGINIKEIFKENAAVKFSKAVLSNSKAVLSNLPIVQLFDFIKEKAQDPELKQLAGDVQKGLDDIIEKEKQAGAAFIDAISGSRIGEGIKTAVTDATNAINESIENTAAAAAAAKKELDEVNNSVGGSFDAINQATLAFPAYTEAIEKTNLQIQSLALEEAGLTDETIKLGAATQGIDVAFRQTADGVEIVNKHLAEFNERAKALATLKSVDKLISKQLKGAAAIEQIRKEAAAKRTELLGDTSIAEGLNKELQTDKLVKGMQAINNEEKKRIDLIKKPLRDAQEMVDKLDKQAESLGKSERELFIMNQLLKVNQEEILGLENGTEKLAEVMERIRQSAGALFDQKEAMRQMKAGMQEIASLFERSFDRIGKTITEMFLRGEEGAISFGNVMRSIGSEMLQLFAQLAFINPIKNAFVGGFGGTLSPTFGSLATAVAASGGAAGGAAGAGGGAGGGGGGILGTAGSIGGLLSGISRGLSTGGVGNFAASLAARAGLGNDAQMHVSNAFSSLGFGALGSLAANLFGLGGSGGVSGLVGGSLGTLIGSAAIPIPGLGGALGGFLGSIVGGLFGGGIERQTGGGQIETATGRVLAKGSKGATPEEAIKFGQGIQKVLAEFADITGATLSGGGFGVRTIANAGEVGEPRASILFDRTFLNFNSIEEALQKGILELIRNPRGRFLQDIPKEFADAVKNAGTTEELLKMAKEIANVTKEVKSLGNELLNITPFGQQIIEVTEDFRQLRNNAHLLGVSLNEVNKAEGFFLRNIELDIVGAINSVAQNARSILGLDALTGFREQTTFGGLSPLAPVPKFEAVKDTFNEIAQAALAGDQAAIARLPSIAGEALNIGRDVFASGPDFASFFDLVTSTVDRVIGNQQALAAESGIDLDFTIRETTELQLAAMKEMQNQLSQDLRNIRIELQRNRNR